MKLVKSALITLMLFSHRNQSLNNTISNNIKFNDIELMLDLNDDVSMTLYNLYKDAITNSIKHIIHNHKDDHDFEEKFIKFVNSSRFIVSNHIMNGSIYDIDTRMVTLSNDIMDNQPMLSKHLKINFKEFFDRLILNKGVNNGRL